MIKTSYRQNLPHIHPIGATFFITFRLQNSLPIGLVERLKEEYDAKVLEIKNSGFWLNPEAELYRQQKIFFKKYDDALDKIYNGIDYLKNPKVAQIVADKIHQYDGEYYNLLSYSIMPNHVHLVFDTALQIVGMDIDEVNEDNYVQVSKIMGLIKGGSGYDANKFLGLTGKFWQRESYDHYARNGKELVNIIWYVIMNPVKTGLVKEWQDHPFTYCTPP